MSIIKDAVEISSYSVPIWGSIAAFVLIKDYPPLLLIFPMIGLLGLTFSIGLSRTSSTRFTLITWPVPRRRVDQVTFAIAYNSTLFLGVVIANVSWLVTDSWYWGALFAMITPIWFLHHLQFFIYEL